MRGWRNGPGPHLVMACLLLVAPAAGQVDAPTELDSLVTPAELEFLLTELRRIDPPDRIRELAGFGRRQLELGGGFYGMLPEQLADSDRIPVPDHAEGALRAAHHLARQRRVNLSALNRVSPDYALAFRGESLPRFLDRLAPIEGDTEPPPDGMVLALDTSALHGFFTALADGEIDEEEARRLARLPSNQAMLEHRRDLGYVPEPLPDTDSLAELIRMAGSNDPLDRLWCWINPQNAFGYADLTLNADHYARFLSELREQETELERAVITRIAPFAPASEPFETTFAFTVGWAIRGWATPSMVGLNVEQVKDDWDLLFGTLVEETYHRLQLELCPTASGEVARDFDDLVRVDTGDARYDRLYEIITYTVLEGAANRVRGPFADPELPEKASENAELLARFVDQVVARDDPDAADALISEGLRGNGPLYGLGWALASLIEQHDGPRSVAGYQARGPVPFFRRGSALARDAGHLVLADEVITAVDTLDGLLAPRGTSAGGPGSLSR